MRPSLLDDLGLIPAIEWLVGDLGNRTGIEVQLRLRGPHRRLRPNAEVALFRIVQEALHNVERHSGATHVRVRLHVDRDAGRATVIDDGDGFDAADALNRDDPSKRLGLLGMGERAKLAGAELRVSSRPGTGTRVAVTLLADGR